MRISDWSSDVCSSDLCSSAASPYESDRSRPQEESHDPQVPPRQSPPCHDIPLPAFHGGGPDRECERQHPGLYRPKWRDRKSVVEGKSVSVRVDLGCRRILKKKK